MIGAITGVLASRSPQYEYFTSTLYPFPVDDALSVSAVAPQSTGSNLWENPNDDISISHITAISGTLVDTIVYVTYNEPLATEDLGIQQISIVSGTLVDTIVYVTYNEPLATEDATVLNPTIQSGTLVTTIQYITYNNGLIEDATINNPDIISGTLT